MCLYAMYTCNNVPCEGEFISSCCLMGDCTLIQVFVRHVVEKGRGTIGEGPQDIIYMYIIISITTGDHIPYSEKI